MLLAVVLALMLGVAQAITLSEAVEKVRRETGGQILSAKTEVRSGRQVHVIKVLTPDGRVRIVEISADSVRMHAPVAG